MSRSTGPVFRQELTPAHFLKRAGSVHANRVAVIDGAVSYTWAELRERAYRLANALRDRGLEPGDRVAFLAPNSEPLLLAHHAVLLAGGVLVAINTRLAAAEVGEILRISGARTLFHAPALQDRLVDVLPTVDLSNTKEELEALVAAGAASEPSPLPLDESDTISINFTSGTTGGPKGVMYHHRGAYLNALTVALEHRLSVDSVYLWTLPMFHCNGWTFPWAVAAVGARSICIPHIDTGRIWQLLDEGVTHFCAAPAVLTMLANDPAAHWLDEPVRLFTGGSPPSPTLIDRMRSLNLSLTHTYGLTETYGPFTINVPGPDYDAMTPEDQARVMARQGVPTVCAGSLRVVDEHMEDVPADGTTMGEVVMRGNVVMSGYYDEPDATAEAFRGGWFHSGDLAVRHPDGAIELRDRIKDIIVSGAENVSTIEVEQAIGSHEAILECAVIGVPDEQWGEVPKAFVTLRDGSSLTEADVVAHCRSRLAAFKAPKYVEFGPLPRSSTGKIQKFRLR